jgi:hypothetical protein
VIDLIRDIKQDKRQEGRKKDVSAAWKIRSDFWRSESDVKISLRGCAGFTLVKFYRFAFLRSCFPAFVRPRLPGWRSGLLGSRQKAGKKQLKNAKKNAKNRT